MQSYAAQTGMGEELFKKWQLNVLCETEETLAYRKLKEQLRLK